MPRPKGEPTKVVRLPVALLAPFEAEAKRTQQTVADVLTARLTRPVAEIAAPAVARARRTVRPSASNGLNEYGHKLYCTCAVCQPKKKGSER